MTIDEQIIFMTKVVDRTDPGKKSREAALAILESLYKLQGRQR